MSGVSPVISHSPDEVLMADPRSVDTKVEQSTYEPTEFSIEEVWTHWPVYTHQKNQSRKANIESGSQSLNLFILQTHLSKVTFNCAPCPD